MPRKLSTILIRRSRRRKNLDSRLRENDASSDCGPARSPDEAKAESGEGFPGFGFTFSRLRAMKFVRQERTLTHNNTKSAEFGIKGIRNPRVPRAFVVRICILDCCSHAKTPAENSRMPRKLSTRVISNCADLPWQRQIQFHFTELDSQLTLVQKSPLPPF